MLSQMNKLYHMGRACMYLTKRARPMSNLSASSISKNNKPEEAPVTTYLKSRLQDFILRKASSISELNEVLRMITQKRAPISLMPVLEERILEMITVDYLSRQQSKKNSEDFQPSKVSDYSSMCSLISQLSTLNSRPLTLLRAIAEEICNGLPGVPPTKVLLTAIVSLKKLSYYNKTLISKLVNDLTEPSRMENMSSVELQRALKVLCAMRWRDESLLNFTCNRIIKHDATADDFSEENHKLILIFIHASALLNYRPDIDFEEFKDKYLKESIERNIREISSNWLLYVYSLVVLRIADESHVRSVLSEEFFHSCGLDNQTKFSEISSLLNIRAIARNEMRLDDLNCTHLDKSSESLPKTLISDKFVSLTAKALSSITENNSDHLIRGVTTPFGFNIDFELFIDMKTGKFAPPKPQDLYTMKAEGVKKLTGHRCAIICLNHGSILGNYDHESTGTTSLIPRILTPLGYKTLLLPVTRVMDEESIATLESKLKTMIMDSIVC